MQELIVGTNSYVTIEEADNYVNSYYGKYSPLRVIWSILTDEEKQMYLSNSLAEIESMPVTGRKYSMRQDLQFPRVSDGVPVFVRGAYFATRPSNEIPSEVKDAQVENALGIIEKECSTRADKQFKTLQSMGAMKNIKYSKRDISDTMLGDMTQSNGGTAKTWLTSASAEQMLRPWTGSFRG